MKTYVNFLYRARWPLALFFVFLFGFSIHQARHLKLKSDFKELLPAHFQSVRDLDRIVERVGGTGSLMVAIESEDSKASVRFAEDLVTQLKAYPPEFIQSIEYNVSDVIHFFEHNKYLYMDTKDLKEIRDRLDRRIQKEKLKTTGIYIDFDESHTDDSVGFNTKDIEEKYKSKAGRYDQYTDGYFFGENGHLLAVIIRPPGSSTGIDFSRVLVAKLNKTIADMNPVHYHPSMKIGLTGKFRRVLFEYQTLMEDIISTTTLCISLVGLSVFLYFRRLRMVLLMAWTVFNGTAWAFALTKWQIGYLTTQTAFLGSIIVGNGINFSLILMARYLEERKKGKSALEALQISLPATFSGTLASSTTTAVAFATLLITEIRGFSHFGFIGGLGMFLCWVATYSVLPVFLSMTESLWPLVDKNRRTARFQFSIMTVLGNNLTRWARQLTGIGVALTLVSIPLIVLFVPNSLEYDFSKLRVKSKGKEVSEEAALSNRVGDIFGGSMTPAVLVTDRIDQVKPLCDEILRKNSLDPFDKQVVDNCKTVFSYVPEEQDEKLKVLASLRHLLEDNALNFLKSDQRLEMDKFKAQFTGKKLTVSDLPETMVKNFREKNGDLGKVVFVYPNFRAPLWDGKNLIKFADLIRENKLPSGELIHGSGESAIFADILRAVIKDGPKTTLMAFAAVCLLISLIFREKRGMFFIIGILSLGTIWMGGLIALFKIKINFFNFIAIPTTFGIGVDYGCNIYQRYREEGKGSLPKVLKTTGGAVALCSLTTMIGYFTLIIAKNQALVSFGWIAIFGELTCLAAALIFVPALVTRLEGKKV